MACTNLLGKVYLFYTSFKLQYGLFIILQKWAVPNNFIESHFYKLLQLLLFLLLPLLFCTWIPPVPNPVLPVYKKAWKKNMTEKKVSPLDCDSQILSKTLDWNRSTNPDNSVCFYSITVLLLCIHLLIDVAVVVVVSYGCYKKYCITVPLKFSLLFYIMTHDVESQLVNELTLLSVQWHMKDASVVDPASSYVMVKLFSMDKYIRGYHKNE